MWQLADVERHELCGTGGFGEVFRGIWAGTEVAVKRLHRQDLSKELLDDSDELLGLSGSEFEGTFRRGINSEDSVVLDADRRSLSISFDTYQGIDQIRVLVASSVE